MNYTLAYRNMLRQMKFLVRENLSSICRGRDRYNPPTLEMVWEVCKKEHQIPSLGLFHDALRELSDDGEVRLIPFTRSFATIGTRDNAIYKDGEVMVYIVQGNGCATTPDCLPPVE